jgi:hypothetical protein
MTTKAKLKNAVLSVREKHSRENAPKPLNPKVRHNFERDDCDLAFFRLGPRFRRTSDRTVGESCRIEVAAERRALHNYDGPFTLPFFRRNEAVVAAVETP